MKKTNGKSERPVVICTDRRGVFFGYVAGDVTGKDPITLTKARMCVYWSAATHGVLGLAADGPASGSKVTAAAPLMELRQITCVIDCTPEAAAKWETGRWE